MKRAERKVKERVRNKGDIGEFQLHVGCWTGSEALFVVTVVMQSLRPQVQFCGHTDWGHITLQLQSTSSRPFLEFSSKHYLSVNLNLSLVTKSGTKATV